MPDRALVVGAGVIGLSSALALARRGFGVTLIGDPAAPSASSVAAGMLAPAAEAALDPHAPPYALMAEALAIWPAFAASIGACAAFHRCGTRILSGGPTTHDLDADARVDVAAALSALTSACEAAGVRWLGFAAVSVEANAVRLSSGERLTGEVAVLTAGWRSAELAPGWPRSAPLTPVRGQLIRFAPRAAPADGPMLRALEGYLCPSAEGLVSGATMEPGVAEFPVDHAVADRQARFAREHGPALGDTPFEPQVGVRADTPDHLPLVGPLPNGPLVATGMRRNGWLLAPFVAEMIAAYAAGEDPGPWVETLSPARFSR